ncbi:MAG: helix-turn-helix domain-containing protein [Rhodanobacter sp.]
MAGAKKLTERAAKSLYRPENQTFLAILRAIRERAGLTQAGLAERLERSQNYVTAAERGVTRLDGLQLRDWCRACGTDLMAWAAEIEKQLTPSKRAVRKVVRRG